MLADSTTIPTKIAPALLVLFREERSQMAMEASSARNGNLSVTDVVLADRARVQQISGGGDGERLQAVAPAVDTMFRHTATHERKQAHSTVVHIVHRQNVSQITPCGSKSQAIHSPAAEAE